MNSSGSSVLLQPTPPAPPEAPLLESESTESQHETELECKPYFVDLNRLPQAQIDHLKSTGLLPESGLDIQLLREKHIEYLSQVWKRSLKASFVSLDSSRPWILYWCLHGCDLLEHMPTDEERCRMVNTMKYCWSSATVTEHPVQNADDDLYYTGNTERDTTTTKSKTALQAGGFGGGPDQMPHAATTYAAVLALCIILTSGGESAAMAKSFLSEIRIPLYRWMAGLLQKDSGAFRMHNDGEVDVRASYTLLCCAKLLQIDTPFLCQDKVVNFIRQCQTFEGGLGGEPWREAHGGYAYCGVAALQLLNKMHVLNLPALTGWLARRQMSYEGGFSGRSNKLVDGCYSFWQGGAVAITSRMYRPTSPKSDDPWLADLKSDTPTAPFLLCDAPMLERYILLCAQDVQGGLRDKPSKPRDFYHTCYNLSGLTLAQNYGSADGTYGDATQTKLPQTHPCYNIRLERVQQVLSQTW